jgi:hypothetical protein
VVAELKRRLENLGKMPRYNVGLGAVTYNDWLATYERGSIVYLVENDETRLFFYFFFRLLLFDKTAAADIFILLFLVALMLMT